MASGRVPVVVVMGVSAAGKSSVARALAERLGCEFRDADDLHPAENIAKMASGTPLTDEDRWPWLDLVGLSLAEAQVNGRGIVMACSALKRSYRDALRARSAQCYFVHLTAPREVLEQRIESRADHFMPSSMLDSQLVTLEALAEDEIGVSVDVTDALAVVVDKALVAIDSRH